MGLELPSTALAEAFDEDPTTRETIARAVLRKFFEVDAHRTPLVLVIEDLHLAGAEGARFLRALIESMSGAPVTVIVTTGPELFALFREWPAVIGERQTRVDLGPLDEEEARVLARALLARVRDPLGEIPHELVDAAVEMAGGLPMLLEQIARIYFERDVVGFREDGTAWVDVDKLDELELPMSVEDAVRTRLAALSPPERELLEKGAVMGPVFWLGGLVVLGRAHKPAPELWGGGEDLALQYRDWLVGLEQKDFVLRMPESSIPGDEEYIFKHNLERETLRTLVAHESAREFHLLLAEWLEFRLTDRTEEHLDLLAEHYELGDRPLRAARCYLESADRARARYANTKAVDHYRKGLALLGDFDVRLRFDAELHLGDVLQRLGQVDAAQEAFRSMQAIAYRLDLRSKGGAAHNRIGRAFREVGQLDVAMRHLGTALALFESASDDRGIAASLDDIGKVHWLKGTYDAALRFMRDALERREKLGDKPSIALSLHNIGSALQDSGQYREGLEALTRALELRREVDDLPGLVMTLNNLGTIHQDRGEIDAALRVWLEALGIAREVGDGSWAAACATTRKTGTRANGKPKDWDHRTDARPEEVVRMFRKVIPTGIQHGTVTVVLEGGQHYEVTTLRGEGAYSDGRRPDTVEFVDDITADLARRDFTFNAIAHRPVDGHDHRPLRRPEGPREPVLRAVGDALERFARTACASCGPRASRPRSSA
jgi:tetratricopeptide (TPR) repeat protein